MLKKIILLSVLIMLMITRLLQCSANGMPIAVIKNWSESVITVGDGTNWINVSPYTILNVEKFYFTQDFYIKSNGTTLMYLKNTHQYFNNNLI